MKLVMSTPAQLAEILSSARKAKGMTQAEAASRVGIGQPRLSLLETTATETITLNQMLALTALYGLELCVQSKGDAVADHAQAEW
ncbi:XRE family transcriptional regulator [Paraburkholderia sp.]|uniref:XRE family transcriptional regulator n=1 Tax=Paraburkholderia sp. TaxID=1926495 RepID=UPI003D6DE26C